MTKIIIFGAGKTSSVLYGMINSEAVAVIAFVDNKKYKTQSRYLDIQIINSGQIKAQVYDYIIIGSVHFDRIVMQLPAFGVPVEKILVPFAEDEIYNPHTIMNNIFLPDWKVTILSILLKVKDEMQQAKWRNLKYEVLDERNSIRFPKIRSDEETVECIRKGYSMCRFGDGEFEIMQDRNRAGFQRNTPELSRRLREIVRSEEENLLICLANNYGNLDQYTDRAAHAIRKYMTEKVREEHYAFLDFEKTYYDAYLTRPYVMYRDRSRAAEKFYAVMQIWKGRNVVIIEGEGTRMGVGNNLLEEAGSVERIIAPSENAYEKYREIFDCCLTFEKEKLFLIALGPTATVLAFDLHMAGYQALDIGHLDIEYEWFVRQAEERINIKEKYVNEFPGGDCL